MEKLCFGESQIRASSRPRGPAPEAPEHPLANTVGHPPPAPGAPPPAPSPFPSRRPPPVRKRRAPVSRTRARNAYNSFSSSHLNNSFQFWLQSIPCQGPDRCQQCQHFLFDFCVILLMFTNGCCSSSPGSGHESKIRTFPIRELLKRIHVQFRLRSPSFRESDSSLKC